MIDTLNPKCTDTPLLFTSGLTVQFGNDYDMTDAQAFGEVVSYDQNTHMVTVTNVNGIENNTDIWPASKVFPLN